MFKWFKYGGGRVIDGRLGHCDDVWIFLLGRIHQINPQRCEIYLRMLHHTSEQ